MIRQLLNFRINPALGFSDRRLDTDGVFLLSAVLLFMKSINLNVTVCSEFDNALMVLFALAIGDMGPPSKPSKPDATIWHH
jgi:hypothetical protein